MRSLRYTICAIGACAAFATLVGCSERGSQTPPGFLSSIQGGTGFAQAYLPMAAMSAPRETAITPLVFTAFSNVDIYWQGKNHKMTGQITGLNNPTGLVTDAAGNLYIADTGGHRVLVYAPRYTGGPKLTILDGNNLVHDVAVSREGVVALANVCKETNMHSCVPKSGSIVFYPKDSTTPCATIVDPSNFPYQGFDAFDAAGNLYVLGTISNKSIVGEITGGCNARGVTRLPTANTLSNHAVGIHLNMSGQIAILDQTPGTRSAEIYTYNSPRDGSLHSPVTTTRLKDISYINDFAFRASGRDIYATDYGVIEQYDYPAGGASESSITLGGDYSVGVAVTPPLIP